MQNRICPKCGQEFTPKNANQKYCRQLKQTSCAICGRTIEYICGEYVAKACDAQACVTAYQQQAFAEKHNGAKNPMQLPESIQKIKATNIKKYGSEWYTQTSEYKERVETTDLAKYGVKHHLQSAEVIEKRVETVQEKYGSTNVFSSEFGKQQIRKTLKARYGIINPSQNPEMKAKATKHSRYSKLEERIASVFNNYGIEFIHHYHLSNEGYSHEFDFYIPKYKLLIDADGLYFHGYLDDTDGERVRDDYDEVRLYLVPPDHIFHVIVESNEDQQIKDLIETLESVDGNVTKYNSILFDWCRSVKFPYPNYEDKRIFSDWHKLQNYMNPDYVPQCRLGLSAIKQFHKSIYSCHVGNNASPLEGWNDDTKLRQVIRNRLIYKNNVDPSKVLAGFNISKICPCVSIFNPVLARHLTLKYLSEFDQVFDPFSGFSGRMLGVTSCNKEYIGHDINVLTIHESNKIKSFLALDSVTLDIEDIMESSGEYQCLLTCPPYSKKEIYGLETEFKSCDEWIYECLSRFKCRRYVFVVDETHKFVNDIVETITSDSHFNHTKEYVVVIDC